ncbi:hypothetical protein BB559_001683 [Furculomyces boomerangus]|uniref:Secreted beta-glucosidase adg3 n=1 Tax=Furculomyces boomerangus TaxID=61424 RepID=A0A2T9Z144_9FUNG|nr:hypothetical protein BB559_001683 [Furculomyces boomerangus]
MKVTHTLLFASVHYVFGVAVSTRDNYDILNGNQTHLVDESNPINHLSNMLVKNNQHHDPEVRDAKRQEKKLFIFCLDKRQDSELENNSQSKTETASSNIPGEQQGTSTSSTTSSDRNVLDNSTTPTADTHTEEHTDKPTETPVEPPASPPKEPPNNNFYTPEGACRFLWSFDNTDNVHPITTDKKNGGWAMSPDQGCFKGTWCPYACKPGYYSAQWDPNALLYNGPGSMNGGLYCDNNGVLQKPYPNKPYCVKGMSNAVIRNTLGQSVSACQTVYPGNEAMIIPSVAQPGGSVELNIVPSTYWLGTSSQFYVNLAGSDEGQCIWGNSDKPVGNWGPYIFGGGQAKDGITYVSVQYNPLYSEVGFDTKNTYNVEIKCIQGTCNFPPPNECKCEKGVCSMNNGCTVALRGEDSKVEFLLY